MANEDKYTNVVPPECVCAYPALFEPKPYIDPKTQKPKGDPKYQGTFLFDKTADMDQVKAMIKKAAAEAGLDLRAVQANNGIPMKDGDKEAARLMSEKGKSEKQVEHYRGKWIIKATSKNPPDIKKAVKGQAVPGEASEFYSGMKCLVELTFKGYDMGGGYVTPYFNFIVKTGDGPRIGGRDAATVFKGVLGGSSTADPTGGDDIAF